MKPPRKITTLIADDVGASRELLKRILEKLDIFNAAVVADGKAALQALHTGPVDIAFLDIDMPEASGLEVLAAMRSGPYKPWIVIVSGHSTVDNIKTAIDGGAKGFIVKPYSMAKIEDVILRFEAERRGEKK